MNHIQAIYDELHSVCGELLGNEFYFKSIEAAVLNGKHEAKVVACHQCSQLIIDYLKRGANHVKETNNTGYSFKNSE